MRINLRKSLFILPNLFTLSSIFCGFYAILLGAQDGAGPERFYQAALLIIFAMFFDGIDGRVARLTRTQSAFGVQIDSLADVVSFGAAPAVLVYRWSLESLGTLGLLGAFTFTACGAIRLARFNVLSTSRDGTPQKPGKYIAGLPIPGAAALLVSLVAANHAVGGALSQAPILILSIVVLLSVFMVSGIRFRSFKDLRLNARTYFLLAFAVGSSVFLAIRLHSAFAVAWLLISYVAIGLVEASLSAMRRLRERRRNLPEDDEQVVDS